MPPALRDQAGATVGGTQSRTATATFKQQTLPGSLLVCYAISMGGSAALIGPVGFTLAPGSERVSGPVKVAVWYCEGAPPATTVSVSTTVNASLQIRIMEYTGAAQAGAFDKIRIATGYGALASAGQPLTPSQPDSIVVSCVANQYASTVQSAVSGLLTALLGQGQVTPQSGWGWLGLGSDPDDARSRLTVHQAITNAVQSFVAEVTLSAFRYWVAVICTFKGGSSGPVRMAAEGDPVLSDDGGDANLVVFGKLATPGPGEVGFDPVLTTQDGEVAIGPFVHQYCLGGIDGLRIGEGTDFPVVKVSGLGGWDMRVSDTDRAFGDGSNRGTDQQSARLVTFELNTGDSNMDEALVEQKLDYLYRALVPQALDDWPLVWRDAGSDLQVLYCRPTSVLKDTDWQQLLMTNQTFALRAANPRIYSAITLNPTIPNTPAGSVPVAVSLLNAGRSFAHPIVRITPTSVPLTRVELRNLTHDLTATFEVVVPVNQTLTFDVEAIETGNGRLKVHLDGQPKFGGWQHRRVPWVIPPGLSNVTLTTVPAGAPVICTAEYRHTSAG